jgi:hypothetical protein
MNQKMNPNLHNEGDPPYSDDLSSLTIRGLLTELTRLEDRLNSRRAAAGYQANAEIARIERQMNAIRMQLRAHRTAAAGYDSAPLTDANEADRVEQSIPVDAGLDEEYPHQQEIDHSK